MLEHQKTYQSVTTSDAVGQILSSLLRGLEIEYKRESTNIHLLSQDKSQVDSLLLALDQVVNAQRVISDQLVSNTSSVAAASLLHELVASTNSLRDHHWPEYYHSCEALERLLDILTNAQHSLTGLS